LITFEINLNYSVFNQLEDYRTEFGDYNTTLAYLIRHEKNCWYNAEKGYRVLVITNLANTRFEELKPRKISNSDFLRQLLALALRHPSEIWGTI